MLAENAEERVPRRRAETAPEPGSASSIVRVERRSALQPPRTAAVPETAFSGRAGGRTHGNATASVGAPDPAQNGMRRGSVLVVGLRGERESGGGYPEVLALRLSRGDAQERLEVELPHGKASRRDFRPRSATLTPRLARTSTSAFREAPVATFPPAYWRFPLALSGRSFRRLRFPASKRKKAFRFDPSSPASESTPTRLTGTSRLPGTIA